MAAPQLKAASAVADHPAPKPTAADVAAHRAASYVRPARRLVAAGVKRGMGPLVVEQPQHAALTLAVTR